MSDDPESVREWMDEAMRLDRVVRELQAKAAWRPWDDDPPMPPRWVLGAILIGGVWDVGQFFSGHREFEVPYSHWREIDPPTADIEWAPASSIDVYVVSGGYSGETKTPLFVTRNRRLTDAFAETFPDIDGCWCVEVHILRSAPTLSDVCGTEFLGVKALARVREIMSRDENVESPK